MDTSPIELIFYDDEDKETQRFSRKRIPSYLLDEAINLQNAAEGDGQKNSDAVFDFVVEFYGNKFTREELKKQTDLLECLSVIISVVTRASSLTKEFARLNPQVPSPKKK